MDIKEAAQIPAAAHDDASSLRRRIFAAGIAGAASSLLPWLKGTASASPTTDTADSASDDTSGDPFGPDTTEASDITTGGTDSETDPTGQQGESGDTQAPTGGGAEQEAATTTTAPPKKPTAADIELLNFAQSVELTIRDLYDVAITAGVFEGLAVDEVNAIREAHEGYGTAIAGLIGRGASNSSSVVLFGQLQATFVGDPTLVAASAAALEDAAVATHLDILDQLSGIDGSALIASIITIEARHATVLKAISGVEDLTEILAAELVALSPSDYPVE